MPLEFFDAPGRLNDLTATQKQGWSSTLSDFFESAAKGTADPRLPDAPRVQFYNPTKIDTGPDSQTRKIEWTAFPRQVSVDNPGDHARWAKADSSRDCQDEYCEWSVERVAGP